MALKVLNLFSTLKFFSSQDSGMELSNVYTYEYIQLADFCSTDHPLSNIQFHSLKLITKLYAIFTAIKLYTVTNGV